LFSEADPYLVVKCGKEKAESLVQANTTDPVWNFSAIFYRSRPEKDALKIQAGLASGLYMISASRIVVDGRSGFFYLYRTFLFQKQTIFLFILAVLRIQIH
jgi:hypothetical protein